MDITNTNILVVDDKQENLYSLQAYLKNHLNDVVIYLAISGEEALQIARNEDIDLIILDVQMPNMDGFEIAKYLTINPRTKDIPIIFLTAVFKAEEFKQKGFNLGAIDYLIKPVEHYKLVNQINLYKKIMSTSRLNKILNDKIQSETQKRLKQERITMYQSKMATMGEMMANIAHQWRQPLSAIINTVDFMKLENNLGKLDNIKMDKNLDTIAETVMFLSNTIDTFRNFFREEKEEKLCNLKEMIEDIISIIGTTYEKFGIKIIENYEDISIYGYEHELEQAILNILNNAKDALIEKNVNQARLIFISTYTTPIGVKIDIVDSGGGITDDVLPKIFEPYFTTKHPSVGTGIGLYMTYQIIVDHFKGAIVVSNEEYEYKNVSYKGAKVSITLPNNQHRGGHIDGDKNISSR